MTVRKVIICQRHNYRDVPFYAGSGDVPECMGCVREADQDAAGRAAYWASRSQCAMCIAGGDCSRHGFTEVSEPATPDDTLRAWLMTPMIYGTPLAPLAILSPNHCEGNAPF